MVNPISPREAMETQIIPDAVASVVNDLLRKRISNRVIQVTQVEVENALIKQGLTTDEIYSENMMDFENAYRQNGWTVEYNRASYSETHFSPYWSFTQ